jgi:sialic acid synthase SpsE
MNNKKMIIGSVKIGDGCKPITIAEAAVEHLGSINVAMRMADSAKDMGADFIKFQMHIPEEEMIPNVIKFWGGSLDEILENYNLTINEHKLLIEYCSEIGIEYLCTPFCPEAVDVLDKLGVKGYKTGSGEMSNFPLMKRISETGKPVIISTGMSTIDEIRETVDYMKSLKADFMLTNCTSIYPSPYEAINLKLIPKYRKEFDVLIGHSDHTSDMWTSLGAITLGACVIEKHFTLSRALKGPDYLVSLEPKEFDEMIKAIGKIYLALGDEKILHEQEVQVKDWAHHSVVAVKDIRKGDVINKEMISVKRPGSGIPAKNLEKLYGRTVSSDLKINSILQWSDIER